MPVWEYKVVAAPTKGQKAKGVKTPEARFAHALETFMNELAAEGWEYQRAETLPSVERSGLTKSTTEWRNLLVFRRAVDTDQDAFEQELLPPPEIEDVSDTGAHTKQGLALEADRPDTDTPETTKEAVRSEG